MSTGTVFVTTRLLTDKQFRGYLEDLEKKLSVH